jgi:predicted ArsR family transcriptional regulator
MATTFLNEGDARLVECLRRAGSLSVQDLMEALGVTETAVRQRLSRLLASGLVRRREAREEGRGRPSHVYEPTEDATRIWGANYGDLAAALWKALRGVKDPATAKFLKEAVVETLSSGLSKKVDGATLEERLGQLKRSLEDRGILVELDVPAKEKGKGENPAPVAVLREYGCPYRDLARGDHGVCSVEREAFERVLNATLRPVESQSCGSSYCEFLVSPKPSQGAGRRKV